MSDDRRGVVPLDLADGRTILLRFTWRAIDTIGRVGVTEMIEKVGAGEAGDMSALAKLIEAASNGAVNADDMMDDHLVSFTHGYVAVIKAWAAAARRPEGAERAENPPRRLLTWLKTRWRRPFQSA